MSVNHSRCKISLHVIYLVYLPQICNMNTLAIKIKLITSTGTGPTLRPGESSV